jgi:hypothetical protein
MQATVWKTEEKNRHGVGWISLALDNWRTLLNVVMNRRCHKRGKCPN